MRPSTPRDDPRPKKACAVCGKPRKLTSPKKCQLPRHAEHLKKDAFCSSRCCRKYHKVEFKSDLSPWARDVEPEAA